MNKSLGWGALAGFVFAAAASAQHSIWLPEKRDLVITPAYLFQEFSELWRAERRRDLGGEFRQHTASLGLDYGLTEDLALDASSGWMWSEIDATVFGAGDKDSGLIDTTFGVRRRFVDATDWDFWWLPSLGARVGGIIAGTYDENLPFAAGDGASGVEGSLLAGKTIWKTVGAWGDVGYRYREGRVPDECFGSFGVFGSWKFVNLTAAYRFTEDLSGNDIGDPGFKFRTVKEISQNVEVSIGFTDTGRRHYQLFYAHTFAGRNTGAKDIYGAAISVTW